MNQAGQGAVSLQNRYCVEHMVKASGQIEKELGLLQRQTEAMSNSLEPLYDSYLKALSEAGKRQLVMAAYHLCTRAYPDRFLALSWEQRNQVQQGLQALSGQIYSQLSAQREQAKKMSRRSQPPGGLAFLQRLLEARAAGATVIATEGDRDQLLEKLSSLSQSDPQPPDAELSGPDPEDWQAEMQSLDDEGDRYDAYPDDREDDSFDTDFASPALDDDESADGGQDPASDLTAAELDDELDDDLGDDLDDDLDDDLGFDMEVPAADPRLTISEEDDLLAALEGLARRSIQQNEPEETDEAPLTPIHLVKQQMLLEKAMREVFKAVSEEANELLQKANIMPSFPKALMAAATDSQGMGEPINAVPNVVTLSVRVMHGEAMLESEEDDEPERPRSRRRSSRPDRRSSGAEGRSPRSRPYPSDRRAEESRSPRLIPSEAVEIDALPELAAISLRLSEVEFTDPTVSAWRRRLRQKLGELKQLGIRYKKTQRALETAQAEDAWRASWTVRPADETG